MKNLVENGIMSFKDILVFSLPKGFKINGSLDLRGSSIKELPENLTVTENLYLNENIEELPNSLLVCGDLYLENSLVTEIPNEAFLLGEVFGNIKNYTKQKFTPNKIYKRVICCSDGTVVPYSKFIVHERITTEPYYYDRGKLIFYYGEKPDLHAVSYQKNLVVPCNSFTEGEQKIERILLAQKDFDKYKNWNINTKYSVDELKDFFIFCTDACPNGTQKFIDDNVNKEKLYTLKELKELLEKFTTYKYTYLFMDKYKEISEKRTRKIMIN